MSKKMMEIMYVCEILLQTGINSWSSENMIARADHTKGITHGFTVEKPKTQKIYCIANKKQ